MRRAFPYLMCLLVIPAATADLKSASEDGFQILISKTIPLTAEVGYHKFSREFNQWYDSRHSYTGDAANLSLDLQQRCMLEKLPNGGFVRHMEIVFHQPGQTMRMTGGLGPLQEMGVCGSLTVRFHPIPKGGSQVQVTYNVSGQKTLQLDKIAGAVDQVLEEQFTRFEKHCRGTLVKD